MRILMLGTKAKGGMSAVAESYLSLGLEGCRIIFIPTHIESGFFHKGLFFAASVLKSLPHLIRKDCSIIHMHVSIKGSILRKSVFMFLAKLFRKKTIVHTHGADFFEYFERQKGLPKTINSWLFRNADRVIVLSEKRKEQYLGLFKDAKARVIPNFVEMPKMQKKKKMQKKVVSLLFMGRLGERKGSKDLIMALEKIKGIGFKASLCGDGEVEEHRVFIKSLGLEDKVELPGWISGEEKKRYLQEADIFVLPSYFEDLPMSILEAMSYSLPIISTKIAGIPEMVENKKNGFLITPGDIDSLASHIKELSANKKLREKMGMESKKIIIERYEKGIVKKRIEELYSNLI